MPPSADLLALLNACRADPVGDLPRLVLADWLDEHDDPARAEFLRVQCELARPSLDTERTATLKLRERALIDANWRAWAGGLHELCCDWVDDDAPIDHETAVARYERRASLRPTSRPRPTLPVVVRDDPFLPLAWTMSRGLLRLRVEPHRPNSAKFRRWSRSDEASWLESVQQRLDPFEVIDGTPPRLPRRLRQFLAIELTVSSCTQWQPVEKELSSAGCWRAYLPDRYWRHVRQLTVLGSEVDPDLAATASTPDYSLVSTLCLNGPNCAPVMDVLVEKPFPRLTTLDIGGWAVQPDALRAFARCAPWLQVLRAWRTPIGDQGFGALLATSWGETLHTLEVMDCDLGDAAMTSLVKSGLLGRLYGPQLNLSMNRIADAGLATLADSEDLLHFSELILRENRVGDAGVEALAASPFAANLRYLDLWKNRLTDRAATALAASPHLGKLRDLNVRDNALTPAGRAVLTERYGPVAKVGL